MKHFDTLWNVLKHFDTLNKGERMTGQEQNNITQAEQVEPITIYQNNIMALVDDVKELAQYKNKSDDELKSDRSFFPTLVDYIYNNYIGDLLGNKHGKQVIYKDIEQLDYLFNIYTSLVYKYKWNNRPLIVEYSIFTGISRDSIYKWLNGNIDNNTAVDASRENATRERSDTVRKWVNICERALIDGSDTIKDIFILKAKHGFKEAGANEININVSHKAVISAEELPALIGLGTQ